MINRILRLFKKFYRAYVDDIVIYSKLLLEYISNLALVFKALLNINIHIFAKKSFLEYPFI